MKSTKNEIDSENIQIEDIVLDKDDDVDINESHQDIMLENESNNYQSYCDDNSLEISENKHLNSVSNYSQSSQNHGTELLVEDQNVVIGSLIGDDDNISVINEDVQFSTCHDNINLITDAQESSSILLGNDSIVIETETENLYSTNLKDLHLEHFTDDENEMIPSNNCAALTLTTDSCSSTCDETMADDLEPSIQKIQNLDRHADIIVENDPNQIEEKFTDAENYVLENLSGDIIIDDSTGLLQFHLIESLFFKLYFFLLAKAFENTPGSSIMDSKELEDDHCQSILKTNMKVDPLEDRNILLSYGLKMEEKCDEDNFDDRKRVLEQEKFPKITKDYPTKVTSIFTTTSEKVSMILLATYGILGMRDEKRIGFEKSKKKNC
jgi:hypothetical protein